MTLKVESAIKLLPITGGWGQATCLVLTIMITIILFFPQVIGWYLPFMVSAAVICARWAWPWIMGRRNFLDPLGIFGFFGVIYFMVSPLLQLGWNWWFFIPPLPQPEKWITIWSALNLSGLLLVLWLTSRISTSQLTKIDNIKVQLKVDNAKLWLLLVFAMGLCLVAFFAVLLTFGGVAGMINNYGLRLELGRREFDPTSGMGIPMMFADSFKNLLAISLVWWMKDKPWAKQVWVLPALLAFMLPICLVIGSGLMGSRNTVIITMFWTLGLYHIFVRPVGLKFLLFAVLCGILFANIYQLYKFSGIEGIQNLFNAQYYQLMPDSRSEPMQYTLSRDIGRMDIQSYALYRYLGEGDMSYSLGRSYLTAPFAVVPSFIMEQPEPFTKEKTELILGVGTYAEGLFSSMLMGQAGEMLANFGIIGFLAFFALVGFYVAWLLKFWHKLPQGDLRLVIIPILVTMPIRFFLMDSTVIIMFLFRTLTLPLLVIYGAAYLSSHRQS